jgi:hypothetical protein
MGAHHGGVEHLHQMRGVTRGGQRLKKTSNTPARLRRQKRFQMLFQGPNAAGRARQMMLW